MNLTQNEIIGFIKENDIKFIRLSFIDLDGEQKNIAVMADSFKRVIEGGYIFDGATSGLSEEGADLKLFPDLSTLHILAWRPQHGRVARFLCDVKTTSDEISPFDVRFILKSVVEEYKNTGITFSVGTGSEFYLFKTDETGNPTTEFQDKAGYFDVAPLDRGENVRREICLTLEEMGISPLSSHHEKGPGQNEINFLSRDPLVACDNQVIFKSVVKAVATRNGLFASFMPKPSAVENGNGLSVDLKMFKDKKALFDTGDPLCDSFTAGVLSRAREICLFTNSVPNSFERLCAGDCASDINLSVTGERSAFARYAVKNGTKRFELRSVDGAANIYLVVALTLAAGLEGIKNRENFNLVKVGSLPKSFSEAIKEAAESEFVNRTLGEEFVKRYTERKSRLAAAYEKDPVSVNAEAFRRI